MWDYREGFGEELGELRDAFKEELGELFGAVSDYKLTKDKNLKGSRTFGSNQYIGEYSADYDAFTGQELIFGGTALQLEEPQNLKITYSLEISSGTAKLYFLKSGENHIVSGDRIQDLIADTSKGGVYEISLSDGNNFIVIEGDDFSGRLIIKSE